MPEVIVQSGNDFHFQNTVDSHGWRNLLPFAFVEEINEVTRIQQLKDGTVVKLFISEHSDGIHARVEGVDGLSEEQRGEIHDLLHRCFSVHWDLTPFYTAMQAHPNYHWIEQKQVGRIFVSPTVWEDLAKTLLTTNTTWAQTKQMVRRLCELGEPYSDTEFSFPTPEKIAAIPFQEFSDHVRIGYRAPYLHELATKIANNELNPEAWYHQQYNSRDLYKEMRALKGFGDYAVGTVMRLLGYFDYIAIDTVCRASYKHVAKSETATDKEIRRYYEPFGEWQGLAMWMDVLREDR